MMTHGLYFHLPSHPTNWSFVGPKGMAEEWYAWCFVKHHMFHSKLQAFRGCDSHNYLSMFSCMCAMVFSCVFPMMPISFQITHW